MNARDLPPDILDPHFGNAAGLHAAPRQCRTIWLSDIHLGTSGCKADYLLDFLRHHDCETLYLVGDIVDGWQLRKGWYWPRSHNVATSPWWKPSPAAGCWCTSIR